MKNRLFIASLCRGGLLGGSILADDGGITYRTGKVSVPAAWRNIRMTYGDIRSAEKDRKALIPLLKVTMADGECWRFLVFGRERLLALLQEKCPGQG